MMNTPDYYEALQVSPNASQEVIEAAYRRLARIYHPDVGGHEGKMRLINEAYEVLRDPERRREYNNFRNNKFTNYSNNDESFTDDDEITLMRCPSCGIRNRVNNTQRKIQGSIPKCGSCGADLTGQPDATYEDVHSKPQNSPVFRKLIFNRYVAILIGVIFVVWILSEDDSLYNSGGTKAPLPAPVQQVSDDVVKFTPTIPAVSLANGTILKKSTIYLQGHGKLHIKNGTSLDAVAKLIHSGTSILTVYIKANSNYTMTGISDGIYWLAFAQGLDWDPTTQKFRHNTQYSSFDETFNFTTTEDDQYIYYPEFEVTFHSVIGGTAETSSVDPAQFDAY